MIDLRLGDCLEIMRRMPDHSVDILTDPPYGIDHIHAGGRSQKDGWNAQLYHGDWDKARPSKTYFDEILRVGKTIIIWGGNYFTDYLPPTMRWLIWDKGQRNFSLADFEMAWTNQNNASRVFDYPRSKALQDGKVFATQKPISLMEWCLKVCKIQTGSTVLDPFMGSGSTGVACVRRGISFIGIDIDPESLPIAQTRTDQAKAQGALFVEAV